MGLPILKMGWKKYASCIHMLRFLPILTIFMLMIVLLRLFFFYGGQNLEKGIEISLKYYNMRRFFLVDNEPLTREDFFEEFSACLGVPLSTLALPEFVLKYIAGTSNILTATVEFKMSNFKLKSLGYQLKYPTIKQGIPPTIEQYQEELSNRNRHSSPDFA